MCFSAKRLCRIRLTCSSNVPLMTLTLLWCTLADQPNPAGYEANSVDKRARRSDDDPEHCLQVLDLPISFFTSLNF